MALSSTGVITVEPAPPNGCCQCLQSPSESQLPPASLQSSPKAASGSEAVFKVLPLFWDLEHVRFCTYPLRAESLLSTALQLSQT